MGRWEIGQRGREGGRQRRAPQRPQATQFRCIPAPGPVTSAHSPPLEPRASFQVPSAASSPARASDPLCALSPRGTPRSLSLSRILCRQVRGTFISRTGLGKGRSAGLLFPSQRVSMPEARDAAGTLGLGSFPSCLSGSQVLTQTAQRNPPGYLSPSWDSRPFLRQKPQTPK